MRTEDIPADGPSDWRREPSERRNALLGKLAEECNELAGRLVRAMIQGLDELDPDDGRPNLMHIQDEFADVTALMELFELYIELDQAEIMARWGKKLRYKRPWFEALPDERS
jgi:hypothetical protein